LSAYQLSYFSQEWLHSDIATSVLFVLYFIVYSQVAGLPWSLYYTFVLEEKHGFNKQTLPFFIKDNVKKLILSIVLTAPILSLLIWIIRWGGEYFFIYAWLFITIVSLV
jgi:STE24 endopeptidase